MKDSSEIFTQTPRHNQLIKSAINVHKFGGSSLATTACIERVIAIIRQHCQLNDIIVVSANGDTTDALFTIFAQSVNHNDELPASIATLENEQSTLISSLLNTSSAVRLIDYLIRDIKQLKLWLADNAQKFESDILALGELWSARLLSAVLNERVCPSYMVDSRDFLQLKDEQTSDVDYCLSREKFTEIQENEKLSVVTGYIAKGLNGGTCTLGRNGSDYSATIVAALAGAKNVTLWTDVDGIYSADPRVVPLARKLHRLPNAVAKELGRLGNPVLHAKTLKPLVNHKTHLHVASSFDPEISGTEIGSFGQIAKQEISVTYLNELILATSTSFTGRSGELAIEAFSPICADVTKGYLVVPQVQQKALSEWLASHDTEVLFKPVSIIAAVGYQLAKQADMRARFRRAMKDQRALHFVSSHNTHSYITVLPDNCTIELVNRIHADMTKDSKNIALVVAGLGNIGERFIEMLPQQIQRLSVLDNVHLVGLIGSRKGLINHDGIDVNKAVKHYQTYAKPYNSEQLLSWLTHHPYDELVIVDITPSEDFSALYPVFFEQGIHVIGANKWAASSSTENYNALLNKSINNNCLWLGNTTVGAGLPINASIDELLKSGDEINEISGIFSGTLSWLFQYYDGTTAFSTLLNKALAEGITEPDPREDLSGRDVQRKLLILARMAGFELSLDDIDCESMVPSALKDIPLSEFLSRTTELDDYFSSRLEDAKSNEQVIRYIARFSLVKDNKGLQKMVARVSLETLDKADAFAQLTPCDNIFQIKSLWYQNNPLIIRGPGAGRDVTAGGIHADLVNVCQQLNDRQQQVKIKNIIE